MTRTAVVILNYNGEKLLRQFLPSVIQFSGDAEIIVADNGSTDASVSVIKNEFSGVRLIELKQNFGFCGGYNRALKQIEAQYYVLLNSDVEVTLNWLEPLTNLLEHDHSIAVVQPKVLAYNNKTRFEYAGAGGGFIDALGYPFCRGRIFDSVEEDNGQYNDTREIFWATGACFIIRSSVYHQFGGLDEDLFAHMEEIDLCWKINRTNHKIYYCGESKVYHVGAGTLSYDNPRKIYLNFRNGLILIYKHLDPLELLYKLPLRMLLDWVAALKFILSGKLKNALSVFKAHLHFVGSLKHQSYKRSQIRKVLPRYSRRNVYRRLIIVDFFLLGKKIIHINNPK